MEISSQGSYPANALSNFAAHRFTFDGVECASMEGLLQAFKTKNPAMQRELCKYIGKGAKFRGGGHNWQKRQILYWNGVEYKRDSDDYQNLLTRAYDALFTSESFRSALRAAQNASFSHSMGKKNQRETVLTAREFIAQLNRLRERLIKEYGKDKK